MTEQQGDSGRDAVDVHNRLDKVVLTVTPHDDASASTNLTPTDARQLAESLRAAADAAEATPGKLSAPRATVSAVQISSR